MALTDNLLAYYKFHDGSSGTADDSCDTYNGTNTSISATTGKVLSTNGAYSFNGTSSKVAVGSGGSNFPKPTSAGTVAMWIKTSTQADSRLFYCYGGTNDGMILYWNNGDPSWKTGNGSSNQEDGFSGANNYADNAWHLIIVCWDGTNKYAYVDGTEKINISWANSVAWTLVDAWTWGANDYGSGWWTGAMCEAGVWSRCITSGERSTLYNSGNGLTYAFLTALTSSTAGTSTVSGSMVEVNLLNGILAYYKFNETSGNPYDETANNYDGVSTDITYTVSGKISRCFTFNGTSSKVTIGSGGSGYPKPTTAGTISLWFKTSSTSDARALYSYGGANLGYIVYCNAGGGFAFKTGSQENSLTGTYSDGAWHLLVLGWDGTNKYGYIDNVEKLNTAWAYSMSYPDTKLTIGANDYGSGWWDAEMDEIGYWSRFLTSAERTFLWNSGNGSTYPFEDIPSGAMAGNSMGTSMVSGGMWNTANTHFVSTSGSNSNDGSFGSPWLTIQYGVDQLVAGDTLYIRGGTYAPSGAQGVYIHSDNNDGTSGSHITVASYPGETAVLSGVNLTDHAVHFGFNVENISYWDFKRLTISYVTEYNSGEHYGVGFQVGSGTDHLLIEECVVTGCAGGFACDGSADYIEWRNCDSYNNADIIDSGGYANGFSANINAAMHIFYTSCRAWLNSDDGFDVYGSDGYITWDKCWAFNNGHGNTYNGNLAGDGAGIKLGDIAGVKETGIQRTVTNCLVFENEGVGIDESMDAGNSIIEMHIYNNTCYNNARNFNFGTRTTHTGTISFTNNISYLYTLYADNFRTDEHLVFTTNSWNTPPGVTVTNADFNSVLSTGTTGSRSNGALPSLDFMKLATGSDLIGVGTGVGLTYDGAGYTWGTPPSIGVYEYETGVPNTFDFCLSAVINVINPTTDDLTDCFADAITEYFDPVYEGSHDRLSNFRNYGPGNVVNAELVGVIHGTSTVSATFSSEGAVAGVINGVANVTGAISGVGVFCDWYLPSWGEMQNMNDWWHTYGWGNFNTGSYWTSSEYSATQARSWDIINNQQGISAKTSTFRIRACREFTAGNLYIVGDTGPAGGKINFKEDLGGGSYSYHEISPVDQSASHTWSNITASEIGTTSTNFHEGPNNTNEIVAQGGHTDSAAQHCLDYCSGTDHSLVSANIMGSGTVTGSLGTTDSVDTDVNGVYFYSDASAQGQDHFTVTSSAAWTRYLNDTGDGIDWVTSASPTWGTTGTDCVVIVSENTGAQRSCEIEFTVNMAHKYCTITQYSP